MRGALDTAGDRMDVGWIHELFTYSVVLFNTFVFTTVRQLASYLTDLNFVKTITNELLSTIELCSGVAELNAIYESQGRLIFAIASFICYCCWFKQFGWRRPLPTDLSKVSYSAQAEETTSRRSLVRYSAR